jgi:outer membrane cobalamin receptor
LLISAGFASFHAVAQDNPTVSGVVRDPSGAVVPDATVAAYVGAERISSAVTAADGRYRLSLQPGAAHRLIATKEGFELETVELDATAKAIERDVLLRIAAFGDTLVVTASGTEELRTTVNESITVLNAEQIRTMGANSLGDVVRAVPGLNVESTGREGSLASLFTRGGESDYNLVMIDGTRVNISGGRFNFNRVSAGEIERVEVVRGAQSSLYGSAAIGSVVHVVTKRAAPSDPPRISGSFEAGSFNTRRTEMTLFGGALNRIDYKAGATYRFSNGAFKDLLPQRDRYRQVAADAGLGVALGRDATVRLIGRYSDADGRSVGPIVYGSRDTGTRFDSRDRQLSVNYRQRLSRVFEQTANASYFDSDSLSVDNIVDAPYFLYGILEGQIGAKFPDSPRLVRLIDRPTYDALAAGQTLPAGQFLVSTPTGVSDLRSSSYTPFRRPAFNYRADVTWKSDQVLSTGYEYERETNPANRSWIVENHAWFAQQQFKLKGRWFFTVGARIDDNSRYGTEVSPKASVGGFLLPYTAGAVSSVRTYLNFGRGIKNPVFDELFGSAFVDGNPDLHPESARTLDGGVEASFFDQRWLARLTYFDNAFRDQVAFFSTGSSPDQRPDYINIDGSKARGAELEFGLQRPWQGVTATAGYAFVDTEVTTSVSTSDQFQPGQPLLRRPKHSFMVQGRFLRGPVSFALTTRRIGERHDSAFMPLRTVPAPGFPTGRPANITVNPAYTWMGLSAEYRLRPGASLYVRADNLTASHYESALGYPGLPRAAVMGIRFEIVPVRR